MYRIALLVNGTCVSGLVADLVDWAEAEPDIEICALVIHPMETGGGGRRLLQTIRRSGLYAALSKVAFLMLEKLEHRLVLPRRQRALFAGQDIGARVGTHVVIQPKPSKSGVVHRFSDEDVQRVRDLDADLLIRTGGGILKGDILAAARHGVLSMHHGDNRINRGGPPGFWEVFERQPATGFIVQRLEAELDGGEVLYRGSFLTQAFFSWNRASLFERSNVYLKAMIRTVLEKRARPEERLLYANRLYRAPLLHDTLRYVFKTLGLVARRALRALMRRRWRWGVSYTPGSWRKSVLWRARTIPSPAGHFLADPFVVAQDGRHFIFVEDYCYRLTRANIAAYRVDADRSWTRLGTVIEEDFHLSFPSLFRFDGQLYMIPESSANRDIRLYRCVDFPLKWELESVLMRDVQAVDALVFEKDGRWWMLVTINALGIGGDDAELHAFHAETPLGPWAPHAGNPIVFDALKGRNGGMLADEGGLYRVAQRPGFQSYGKGASIFRIDELTPESYRETRVQDVDPAFRRGLGGIHHLHQDGELLVFDHVRTGWVSGEG